MYGTLVQVVSVVVVAMFEVTVTVFGGSVIVTVWPPYTGGHGSAGCVVVCVIVIVWPPYTGGHGT